MKIIFLFSTFFLSFVVGHSQTTFQKTYGGLSFEYANSIQQTSDDGFIIAGTTVSFGAGIGDIYLVKIASDGSLQWTKTFGGTGNDEALSVRQCNDGGYVIIGSTNSFGAGNDDIYLVKTASDGTLEWSKTFGGANYDIGNSVQQSNDGGFIITGTTLNYGAGSVDTYLLKTTDDGTLQWTKAFGGTNYDYGNFGQQTSDGGFIITGSTLSFGAGAYDTYLVKTGSDGSLQWTKTFGGTGSDYGNFVQQTSDGGFIIAGFTDSFGAGEADVYVVKTASDGSLQWTKAFGGTSGDYGQSIQETTDGGFVITGFTQSYGDGISNDVYLIKITSDGTLQWSKSYGGATINDVGNSIQQTSDGGFIIVGFTDNFGAGQRDVYLIKTDSNGNSGCNETSIFSSINSGGIDSSVVITENIGGLTNNAATQTGTGGIVTNLCTTVGIEISILIDNPLTIYPNPFSTQTTFHTDKVLANATLTLYNSLGQQVRQVSNIRGQTLTLHRDNLTCGLYYLQLTQDNQTIATDKLIITDY